MPRLFLELVELRILIEKHPMSPISRFADSFPFRTTHITSCFFFFSTQLNIPRQRLRANTAVKMSVLELYKAVFPGLIYGHFLSVPEE